MASKPKNRFIFDQLRLIQQLLIGNSKPCNRFGTFQALYDALGSPNETLLNYALKCLYDRYLKFAAQVATDRGVNDHEKAVDALESVFVTLYQQIRADKCKLESDEHLKNYIRNGIQNHLATDWKKSQKKPLRYDDDLATVASVEGVHIDSDLGRLLFNDALEHALKELTPECQQKLLMGQMGFSHAEIAAEHGILPTSAKAGLYQCRLELRVKLDKLGITFIPTKSTKKSKTDTDETTPEQA